jgi:hypothetical protein
LIGGADVANYGQLTGGATTKAVEFKSLGTDTNVAYAIRSKGTGAIDLAAGSSGVNISNGGTVTALTVTATGSAYTSPPTWSASAPTTAGGTTASGTTTLAIAGTPTIAAGGTGYTAGDVLTFVGGTFTAVATVTVSTVSSGVITAITSTATGTYTVIPSNPISVTGGTGSGATFNANWRIGTIATISVAGSGYVEQPTVTFSGGGGSGAAAYATVGSNTIVKSIGSSLSFYSPGGEQLRVGDTYTTGTAANYVYIRGRSSGAGPIISANGSDAAVSLNIASSGTGSIGFQTANGGTTQFFITNTTSAINYIQVTGGATGAGPTISVQGSDGNAELIYRTKGIFNHSFQNGSSAANFIIDQTAGTAVVNRLQASGSLTGFAPKLASVGSDGNIALALLSKGTGAIDLAAGSSGVNISNGGTVTALTRTATGSGYTTIPSVAIAAPTTAGGVQATANALMFLAGSSLASGGTGYTVGDVLTAVGGTFSSVITLTVSTVSSGVITAASVTTSGNYSALPANPVSFTGGTGAGATFNITWGVINFTITNAGSGYVEQPTVTFSGGGGSGAAAYTTVGGGVVIRSLGLTGVSAFDFNGSASASNNAPILRLRDVNTSSSSTTGFIQIQNAAGYTQIVAQGPATTHLNIASNGDGRINFNTRSTSEVTQMRVSDTASAVNYVQVTGAATGGSPQISAQGSDATASLIFVSKGNLDQRFATNSNATNVQFRVAHTAGTIVNYTTATGNIAGASPSFAVAGTDADIDLTLTPKGAGAVRFGTLTVNADAPITGYITIKDSGGTLRKLAVIA